MRLARKQQQEVAQHGEAATERNENRPSPLRPPDLCPHLRLDTGFGRVVILSAAKNLSILFSRE